MSKHGYHHGDLRRTIVAAAVEAIGESGLDGWSLRELARRAGVSHAAPRHHFGDKTGALTAIAADGFGLLAEALETVESDFLAVGVAYVEFAIDHPVHFAVMFQPARYRSDDRVVRTAEARADRVLDEGAASATGHAVRAQEMSLAAWSIAHGFAGLQISGALQVTTPEDPSAPPVVRCVLRLLAPDPQPTGSTRDPAVTAPGLEGLDHLVREAEDPPASPA